MIETRTTRSVIVKTHICLSHCSLSMIVILKQDIRIQLVWG